MTLLDRYLAAVARNLPAAQAADIAAELRDNLLSEIEEKEAGLGRPLTDAELEALLIDFGHPLSVAARYRPTRYLIGPEVYPFWLATLRVVGGIAATLIVIGAVIVGVSTHLPAGAVAEQLAQKFWPTVLLVFGGVTGVFAVMEWLGKGRMPLKWSPRRLPPPKAPGRKTGEIVSELIANAVFILWWIGIFHFPTPVPPVIHLHLAAVWSEFYAVIAGYAFFQIAIGTLELMRPGWTRANCALSLAKNLSGAVIFYEVLQAGHWLEVNATGVPGYALQSMRHGFDRGMQVGITVTVILMVCLALRDAWRLLRGQGRDGGAAADARALSQAPAA